MVASRTLEDELKLLGERRSISMPSFSKKYYKDANGAQQLLASTQISVEGGTGKQTIMYSPAFLSFGAKEMKFWDWWNAPVYVEGTDRGTGAIVLTSSGPKNLWRLSRGDSLKIIRNTSGAHYDEEVPVSLDRIEKWAESFQLGIEMLDGHTVDSRNNPEEFNPQNSLADATIRVSVRPSRPYEAVFQGSRSSTRLIL